MYTYSSNVSMCADQSPFCPRFQGVSYNSNRVTFLGASTSSSMRNNAYPILNDEFFIFGVSLIIKLPGGLSRAINCCSMKNTR